MTPQAFIPAQPFRLSPHTLSPSSTWTHTTRNSGFSPGRPLYRCPSVTPARIAATVSDVKIPQVDTHIPDSIEETLQKSGYKSGDTVLLFDGICMLCNAGVDFVLEKDTSEQIKFAALQSQVGQALLEKFDAPKDLSTVVFIENNKAYIKSEAVLRVGRHLNWYFSVPAQLALLGVPKPVRDFLYSNVLAKNRYQWFGEKEECRLLDDQHRSRFLF